VHHITNPLEFERRIRPFCAVRRASLVYCGLNKKEEDSVCLYAVTICWGAVALGRLESSSEE
jgi:hypothetical protein